MGLKRLLKGLLKIPSLYIEGVKKVFNTLFDNDYDNPKTVFGQTGDTYEERLGSRGEQIVANMLNSIKDDGYLINNVLLKYNGRYSQIDHILLKKSGIYVVETKNLSGRIYGKDMDKYWTQVLAYGDEKHKVYNPVLQNNRHIDVLCHILKEYGVMFSLIIFVQNNIEYIDSKYVYTISEAERSILKRNGIEEYTASELEVMYNKLMYFKENPPCTREEYIEKVNTWHQNELR